VKFVDGVRDVSAGCADFLVILLWVEAEDASDVGVDLGLGSVGGIVDDVDELPPFVVFEAHYPLDVALP
jgi:hypothetical protein